MSHPFATGQQPCPNFFAQLDEWGENRHSCLGPRIRGEEGECGGLVSFCMNCRRDHHAGGYESCPQPQSVELEN